ncbi:MAG: T9SS type A sorting domain-containing protein [Bacteroidota bacterium]
MKTFIIPFLFILFISPFIANAQGWEKTYDNGHNEWGRGANITSDGGIVIAGTSDDIQTGIGYSYLTKTDANGILEWWYYDSVHIGTFVNTFDVLSTSDSSYMLSIIYGNDPPNNDYVLQKIDSDGNVVWKNDQIGIIAEMNETADGGYIGVVDYVSSNSDLTVLKLDVNGVIVWKHIYEEVNADVLLGTVKQVANGDIIMIGGIRLGGDRRDAFVRRMDSNGNQLWHQQYDNSLSDMPREIVELASGEFVISGIGRTVADIGPAMPTLMKIDANGNQIWYQAYSSKETQQMRGLAATDDGGFVLFGDTRFNGSGNNLYLLKVDGAGTELWMKTYGRTYGNYALDLMEANDGGFYLAASTKRSDGTYDPYLIKTDSLGNSLTNEISGNVFNDDNGDCTLSAGENGLEQWLVQVTKGDIHYSMLTDTLGNYAFTVDTGTYDMQVSSVSPYWTLCQSNFTHTFTTPFDTIVQNVAAQAVVDCPLMDVSIATPFLRRCFDNVYYVQYCNYGTEIAANAYVDVLLDPFMIYIGASAPLIASAGDLYTFDLGDVDIGECGGFTIDVALGDATSCGSIFLGAAHCVEAHIFPDSLCLPSGSWSGASVEVDAICEGDSITFTIRNVGNAATQANLEYLVIEDDVILYQRDYELNPDEVKEIVVEANGSTFRLEAEQEPNHPGMSMPSVTVEGCGDNTTMFSWGFTNVFSPDDANPFIDIDCMSNIGAFDPNDKTGFPLGYGVENNIAKGQDIDYLIRFQNLGTDTAFNIEILDILSQYLDITSVRPGASSHPYDFNISGNGVMNFKFDNIMLPDYNVNEAASHGFVKFKVSQMPDLPIGTPINNSAAIYFDFNAPIITNTTLHTIDEPFLEQNTVSVYPVGNPAADIAVFPNPFSNSTTIIVEGMELNDGFFKLYDAVGRLVRTETMNNNALTFYKKDLPAGLYFFNIDNGGQLIANGKLIIE